MKLFAKLFLILLFIPLTLGAILSSTVKFQLLDANLWKNTLKNNNVYSKISTILKEGAESQTEKGGGKKDDLKILTDVITPSIVEDFISRNLDNSLGFANGKRKEFLVYIPITKIPKELAPSSVDLNSEEIPLEVLLSKFNINIASDFPISQVAYTGMATNYLLLGFTFLSLLCLFLLFILTESGKKLKAPALAIIISGIILLGIVLFGYTIRGSMLTDWVKGVESSQIILSTFAPYILGEILKQWVVIGGIFLILGITLSFIKKPSYTNSKK